MVLLLMGLSWGGAVYPWRSAHVIVTIVLGFALGIAFVLYGTAPDVAVKTSNAGN